MQNAGKTAQTSGIYVESLICGSIEDVWSHTQTPAIHEQWDLRFSTIEYLPKARESDPQRFLYATKIGLGIDVRGEGESRGERSSADGSRTSALKFWSDDWRTLIREGSGYWRYLPVDGGVRFLTWYDYRVRYGAVGWVVDRLFFRPMIGWATAWSFDRLRLWIEKGVDPGLAARMAVIHAVSRIAVAFTWLWQGLMPKLLFPSADEKLMMTAAGLSPSLLPLIGWIEVFFGFMTVILWRQRWILMIQPFLMIAALLPVVWTAREYTVAAFNPVTLNTGMAALAICGYIASGITPHASRCKRRP